ncbi:MAG: MBOAT family protein [Bacteroidales bacterium]|nr:MBOAT family protein [Bacteroidales bacterium]
MLFNSLSFALFLPVVFAVYWLLRRSLRWQNLFVLTASYFFYGCWDWRFLLLIAFTSGCSWLSGILMDGRRQRRDKVVMWTNIAINLTILGLFKYYDFFARSFADLFLGGRSDALLLHLVLPVGISFYTFQALSYSIDVYRGTIKPTRDVVAFFAYVSFFPQLVAGPIERASSLLPQFERSRRFDYALAVDGLRQMLWGFFKKLIVADGCAVYVDQVYADPSLYGGATLIVAAVLFSFQIYGDFSGYSDIAIGCSKLFGIRLRRNFNVPYFSRDIAEFWRRWHISLTSWFRDYLYIPLGGSRVSRLRVVLNTMIIFLVSGFWHGANWTFLAWGFFHALLFMPLILLGRNRRFRDTVAAERRLPSWGEVGRMLLTFVLATVGWVIFRSPSLSFTGHYFAGMVRGGQFLSPTNGDFPFLIPALLILLVVEWCNRDQEHEFCRQPHRRWLRWLCYMSVIFIILAYMQTSEMPFIYFQF